MDTEIHYKGVQFKVQHLFGYRYVFMYFNKEYFSEFYADINQCKTAAKKEIDRLTLGKDVIDNLDV